ncbi:MAG: sigma-70 family RNA polymerase sigma factor [Candidatus Latescibacteria bacterium]|nr:sigma-70 family RNA polymerase sigma factor [Candidatus Latescibacterota bacterium]
MPENTVSTAPYSGGDSENFTALVARHKDRVYGLAVSFLHDFDAAYDVSQEVFLRAFLKLHQLKDPEKLPAWLMTITANVCRSWLAARPDLLSLEEFPTDWAETQQASAATPDRDLEQEEERQLVLHGLAQLAPASRQVLTLYYMGGRSSVDIAADLDITPQAARQRLRRARHQLKEEVLKMVHNTLHREAPGDAFDREVESLLERVKELFWGREYQEAIPLLERTRELVPDDDLGALLMADAYKGQGEGEYAKAAQLLDELVGRQPDNIFARIKQVDLGGQTASGEELVAAYEDILRCARGGPFEGLALLRLARVYAPRQRYEEALRYYRELIDLQSGYTSIAYFDMGVSHYLQGDLTAAISHTEKGLALLQGQSQESLEAVDRQVAQGRYWQFHGPPVDHRLVLLGQTHFQLAGYYMKSGGSGRARPHLRQAVDILDREAVTPARPVLVAEMLGHVDSQFVELADEPLVQALRGD